MSDRPKIRIPVEQVPWASGTFADLECNRRRSLSWDSYAEVGEFHPYCCRWPKSCSAFDPGFTVGKGRTTLPVVWFDGFGWRSGPPDPKTTPEHLFEELNALWSIVKAAHDVWASREEANDDDGDEDRFCWDCDGSGCATCS